MSAVKIESVSKSFNSLQTLSDISFTIEAGELFGLLGVNGAGKSTLINIMAGLTKADSGTVSINGFDVRRQYRDARRSLGVVPQELIYDPFFTVQEILQLQSGYFGIKDNSAWLDELMSELKLTDKLSSNIQSLSGGMKRRLLIAQSLIHKPQILVLDEPTAGVDVELRHILWNFIRKLNRQGTTVILTTHYLAEAESLCETIVLLDAGKLVSLSSKAELLSKAQWQNVSFQINQDLPDTLSIWRATVTNNMVNIKISKDDNDAIVKIMSDLVANNVEFSKFQIKQPTLEECLFNKNFGS